MRLSDYEAPGRTLTILAHTFPVSVIKKAGVVNQDIKAITPVADIHPQFLAACLRSQRSLILTKVTTAGHGTKKLDAEGLAEIRIFLPPMSLQMRFIALVDRHRRLIEDGRNSENSISGLFSALQQGAFRGELDLSRLVLADVDLRKDRIGEAGFNGKKKGVSGHGR